jgi:hypothetical protein
LKITVGHDDHDVGNDIIDEKITVGHDDHDVGNDIIDEKIDEESEDCDDEYVNLEGPHGKVHRRPDVVDEDDEEDDEDDEDEEEERHLNPIYRKRIM